MTATSYRYRDETYCPGHVVGLVTTNPGDVWHGRFPSDSDPEPHLDLLARIYGVDRSQPDDVVSEEFPVASDADPAGCPLCALYPAPTAPTTKKECP